jgi:flavin-dependent dehydrogenase
MGKVSRTGANWASVSADGPQLESGSRVAVVGGGPAGSLFAYFLLRLANAIDLELQVDIFEPRRFTHGGPAGCNHCGGIVSESLVQLLATEGINLPTTVVQRGIYSYVLHMDVGSVEIESPVLEQRIASVYRGNGPRGGEEMPWDSFDGYLQQTAEKEGARIVHQLVTGLSRRDGLPVVTATDGKSERYDLVVLATGVNSNFRQIVGDDFVEGTPKVSRTFISEFKAGREHIADVLGDSMHVFLLDLPRLEFAALIPKGDYVTMAMLGDEIDRDLIGEFLDTPEVRTAFPIERNLGVCTCAPLINMKGPAKPYGDRVVMIGDMGMTRLYKDGIGAAFRTSKAAAEAALIHGISEAEFEKHYMPTCRGIAVDNNFGHVIFAFMTIFRKSRFARRVVLRMTATEQTRNKRRHMSGILWNMFTGSAPYREVFFRALHPAFIVGLVWNTLASLLPTRRGKRHRGAT